MTEKSWNILRPLLNIEKSEIMDYLDNVGVNLCVRPKKSQEWQENNKIDYFNDSETSSEWQVGVLYENNLLYSVDKTNFNTDITRNKLRLDIIPLFSNINKNYKQNIKNIISYFEELKEFINIEALNFLNNYNWNKFNIKDFNNLADFLQREVISYIYYISNNSSTIWLSQANIREIIKFINWKNNKTIKEIKWLKMKKDNLFIRY